MGGMLLMNSGVSVLNAQTALPAEVKSLDDLKKVESRVQKVAALARRATVGLTSQKTGASGSGVIVNKEGLILTAAHVSSKNERMNVIFPDGSSHEAKVLGANRTKDVAMLQLVKSSKHGVWPFVNLGDSSAMKIGDNVIALGHAGGYDTRRPAPVRFGRLLKRNPSGFIMTDTALIGGDSGGPLFDMDGKLIGINSSIGNDWQVNNHAGISALVRDWDKLLAGDTWGQLGANSLADPDRPVMGFNFDEIGNKGVIVTNVLDGSPAREAGFKKGDVLLAIGDKKIKNGKNLEMELENYKPGDVINVILSRKGEVRVYEVKLARRGEFPNK